MKKVPMGNKGLSKLPSKVRNKMGYMNKGGVVPKGMHRMPDGTMMKDSDHKGMAYGGMVNKKKMHSLYRRRASSCVNAISSS